MLDRFNLSSAKPVSTPMDLGAKFLKEQCPLTPRQVAKMQGILYAEGIGSVLWPMIILRLDCTFAVSMLAQFMQNPAKIHWEALKRVTVYLGSTKALWLTFGGGPLAKPIMKGYCDADWAGQPHQHSILGYLFHLGLGAVSWSSKKQYIIALLSTKSEYIVLAHSVKEGVWLRYLISEILDTKPTTMGVNCDNQGAIALTKDNKFHQRSISAIITFVRQWRRSK